MESLIINPGARIGQPGNGWTNTLAKARAEAGEWLSRMHAEGMTDVVLLGDAEDTGDGRWRFTFRHAVTGTAVHLDTHGIDDLDAYRRQHLFDPRVYWNGSSTAEPRLEDFAAPGFVLVRTFAPEAAATTGKDSPGDS